MATMREAEHNETPNPSVPPGDNPPVKSIIPEDRIILTLYIAGQTPRSLMALANLRKLCDEYLVGRYDLEVVDLILNPGRARTDQILAVPTLVRSLPTPIARIIGDLSDTDQVLLGLNIQRKSPE
jgi:circadian clock protein KaiB